MGKYKKILFTSGKGGVGKSTLSTTFAKILAADGNSVLMIDFDMALRTVDIMLGVSSVVLYDWSDVLNGQCTPDAAIIHSLGPDLIAAPRGIISIDKYDIKSLVALYEDKYDYIIMDCPAGVGDVLDATLNVADLVLIISTPDLVCVRSASVAASMAAKANVDCRLIINRFRKRVTNNGRALSIDDVMDATETQLVGVVPEDMQFSLSLLNGELLDKNSKSVKALTRIVKRINGEYIPLKV